MANIATYLAQILSARYGRDVRQSIHDSIKAVNDEVVDYGTTASKKADEAAASAEEAKQTAIALESSMSKVQTFNENILELGIKETLTGTSLHATDTSNLPFYKFGLIGKATQNTTSGKNLLDCSGLTATTKADVTFTPSYKTNGELEYINMNGTATATIFYDFVKQEIEQGSYILSGLSESLYNSGCEMGMPALSASDGIERLYTVETTDSYNFRLFIPSGLTVSNQKIYPMLRLATETDATYEPFTNGASPNHDYEQPITVAGGDGSIKVTSCGKNLLDCSGLKATTNEGVTFTPVYDSNGKLEYINVNGTSTGDSYLNLYKSIDTKITNANMIFSKGTENDVYIRHYFSLDGSSWSQVAYTTDKELTISKNDNAVGEIFRISVLNGSTVTNAKIYPMIRLSTITDGTYEPYTETTAEVSTPNGLASVGDVHDEIVKYADGSGKYIQRVGKAVLNGSESWLSNSAWANKSCFVNGGSVLAKATVITGYGTVANMLCPHFKVVKPSVLSSATMDGISQGGNVNLYISNTDCTTPDELKTWLSSNNVTVYYELATPIETELTAEEVAEIEKLRSFKPITNIFTDDICELEVDYVADTKLYIDNKIAAL